MTDRAALSAWVQRYERAWDSNEPADVEALFTPDAAYRFHPWDDPVVGHAAIVAVWTGDTRDEAGDHRFTWRPIAVEGSTAVLQGRTEYDDGDRYDNLWIVDLADDGRATAFTEWYMEPPAD